MIGLCTGQQIAFFLLLDRFMDYVVLFHPKQDLPLKRFPRLLIFHFLDCIVFVLYLLFR